MDRGQSRGAPLTPEDFPTRGVINVIAGGLTDGDSNQAQKSHARQMESLAIGEEMAAQEVPSISFGPKDMYGVIFSHSDALVIQATIVNYEVAQVLVDSGSSVNVLYQEAFNRMQLEEAHIEEAATTLFGFARHSVHPVGQIILPLTMGDAPSRRTIIAPFLMVDALSTYNVILGCPFLSTFMAVASPYHQKIKFSVKHLVGEIWGDQKTARGCYVEMGREDQKRAWVEGSLVKELVALGVHVLEKSAPRSTLEEGELVEMSDGKTVGATL